MSTRLDFSKISKSQSSNITLTTAKLLLTDLNTSLSRKLVQAIDSKDFNYIRDVEINPSDYNTSSSFAKDYQAISILRKWEDLPTTTDLSAVALQKFYDAEAQCRLTNREIDDRISNNITFFFHLKNHLESILGDVPSVSKLDNGFGPGASSSCSGFDVNIASKLNAAPECTIESRDLVKEVLESDFLLSSAIFNQDIVGPFCVLNDSLHLVHGNKLTFVPKSSKTDRAICIEPHLNVFLQKGVGRVLRSRLKKIGIALKAKSKDIASVNDFSNSPQQIVNAEYARLGSIDGSYATIDLSAASDTISWTFLARVLPYEWFNLLDKLRSPYTLYPNNIWIENNKFSSMGNGFTFELETIVFQAVLLSVRSMFGSNMDRVMTFGDDIIVPTELSSDTIKYLEVCGFSINIEKSFICGPFRESCGKDYFLGNNVRPYFIKKRISNVKDLYPILNGLRLSGLRSSNFHYCNRNFRQAWLYVLRAVPKNRRFYGPAHLGDCVIFTPRSEGRTHAYFDKNCQSHLVYTVLDVARKRKLSRYPSNVQLAAVLFGASEYIPLRGTHLCYKKKRTLIPEWDWHLGTWE
jgi:hypothetical protein